MRTLSLLFVAASVCMAGVTPPEQIKVPPGFKVELLREAGQWEGSWISMTQDDQGRLYISPQNAIPESGFSKDSKWGGIWRVTLGKGSAQSSVLSSQSGKADAANPKLSTEHWALSTPAGMKWDRVQVPVGDAMGMLWAFDSLYVSGMGPQGRGIYRCKSSKGDGNLDTATLFKAIPGGAGEHGAHAIVLGPDKKLYIVNGNSTGILDGLSPDSPYRHWGEDDLLPRLKDPVATFFDKIKAPYGCVYRTDADGTKWELFAGGFRNPYDIAFNPDGELFTYDSDMEWDRGLPWYRPTRILHVVPGGEYGFREGSAKWPAYFPDSLPAVADIGVGCPTGIAFYPGSRDVGTDAKVWPEKYRRALFLHDWTYGRILAVTLHEKGASYTARNDLASYTYPRDAEANGDVEVFLSGKGMPVTDLEFLRDGSMVFTVGGRGTAAALYRVSYVGKAESANAPEAQRKLAGGAASEASATTGSPPAKASAPDGVPDSDSSWATTPAAKELIKKREDQREQLKLREKYTLAYRRGMVASIDVPYLTLRGSRWVDGSNDDDSDESKAGHKWLFSSYLRDVLYRFATIPCPAKPSVAIREITLSASKREWSRHSGVGDFGLVSSLLGLVRGCDTRFQTECLQALDYFPFTAEWMDDDLKLLKLRILELSFARQGRPSEERVKAVMEELLAHYPVPPIPANAATPARNPAAGAPVDAPAWRLNRELCALLTWLSNPELGALNSALVAKAGKVGQIFNLPGAGAANATQENRKSQPPATEGTAPRQVANLPYIAAAKPKDDALLPTEAPPAIAQPLNSQPSSLNSGLGPVPNPGADIFPGRKPAPFQTELGRQVIEKTLALMDAAPSQEEQIWYSLCLRWAHGWTPEQRVRYFRWFHEKASRMSGGNSFAKFVEAIRADAASRVPESERAALASWLRPVAAPTPAAVLKPRAFVKAWTLPELEAALDKLKDRQPDLARGKELYTQAQCAQCHLFRDAGGNVGPDLTAVAQRFGRHDILESITDPSKVVSEQYAMVTLTILDGKGGTAEVSGLVKDESSATITLLTDPLAGKTSNLYKNVVTKREKAAVSIMPPGLLNTLTAEEVADLLGLFGVTANAEAKPK